MQESEKSPSELGHLESDQDNTVLVRKQIGKTTYLIRVHFSRTSKETMQDKIRRMLRDDIRCGNCQAELQP